MAAASPAAVPPNLAAGKSDCPRCGGRYLNTDLRCIACSADFTPAGLAYFRALPAAAARRAA